MSRPEGSRSETSADVSCRTPSGTGETFLFVETVHQVSTFKEIKPLTRRRFLLCAGGLHVVLALWARLRRRLPSCPSYDPGSPVPDACPVQRSDGRGRSEFLPFTLVPTRRGVGSEMSTCVRDVFRTRPRWGRRDRVLSASDIEEGRRTLQDALPHNYHGTN